MKNLLLFSIAICLVFLSFNLSGQNCKASFSALPDSLTSFPYYYHFNDLSSGNIDTWYWDFDDGSYSTEQHPSHQYDEPGNYKVCLSVADLNDTSNCYDQFCMDISTLQYFSLGGLVYAGETPLNNPEMAGDTGIASLYRIVNQQLVFVEDHLFQEYGYYWFGYLFPGKYLVKIGLTKGSTHYNDYFTTYFGDEVSWTKADLLSISTVSLYEAEIHLTPVQQIVSAQGIIRGYVNFEQGNEFSMPPISQTSVIISDINNLPLKFTRPNTAGYFEFTGIPYGTYLLTADATGKPSTTVTIILSESSPLVDGINLTVFGSNQNIIPEGPDQGIFLAQIYPNPVKENLFIKLHSNISTQVGIKVTDVTGRNYFSNTEAVQTGINHFLIPASSLPSGVYLLILKPRGSYLPVTAKFIK